MKRQRMIPCTHIYGTDEVLALNEHVGQHECENEGHNPCPDEALDCLLRRQLDKHGAADGDTHDVGENVVGNDKTGRKEEPDHALEYVVHDEVGLDNNQEESHVCPGKLRELEFVLSGLERGDEKNET